MFRFITGCCLVMFCVAIAKAQERAPDWKLTPELVDAYRDFAVARQRLMLYRQVTLPQQRQMLSEASQQTRLEMAVLDRRLIDYRPFLRVGEYSPVRTAAENDLLTRSLAAQRLRQLQDEEIALIRYSGETDGLYQYDVLRAAVRVRAARASVGR